ncbi:glycoside hydrolase family 9 protein [Roseateles amylovorans]|uniref:Endoglucanase n=1 Tax=Roseateles amylovorans TaxID=2978473 RepID=A0ABY6B619_9BURK|nr:glycoside hydrolase family 9 protein [Roseateles amylovorans]UXH80699.1 glycoside hydrolase family 9 protein [Roseateles amylovorans]
MRVHSRNRRTGPTATCGGGHTAVVGQRLSPCGAAMSRSPVSGLCAWLAGLGAAVALPAAWAQAPAVPVAKVASASASAPAAVLTAQPVIQINQLGFPPGAAKWAVVPTIGSSRPTSGGEPVGQPGGGKPRTIGRRFEVLDDRTGQVVLRGALGAPALWAPAQIEVQLADLSALKTPGRYRVQVPGVGSSAVFRIAADAYLPLSAAAIRAFYFNRASLALTPALAGVYARPAGHADTQVRLHASAVGPERREGSVIDSPKGWYDAGDYNKYIVNSGISVYTLLAAYEHYPALFQSLTVGLPESGNGVPDLLNEALWNIDWMLTMQDPADGGVYHKLTNLKFDGVVMPDRADAERYVVQKSTAATLDFAAVMATASRVLAPFDAQSPGRSSRLLKAAQAAWAWAKAHPDAVYRQPPDVVTGEYGDDKLDDEFAWAAAELYITTRDDRFYQAMAPASTAATVPAWGDVKGLAWVSLAQHRAALTPAADRALIESRLRTLGDELVGRWRHSAWRVSMQAKDFDWGSNSTVLNQALMLIQAARLAPAGSPARKDALDAAQSLFDYVMGRNPLGLSMVTGFGSVSPMHPHHRPSQADGVAAPIPGFIVGGANPGQQDKSDCPVPYPASAPALSYLDHFCSYASNEVAINWNAPLVYVSAALQALNAPPKKGTR